VNFHLSKMQNCTSRRCSLHFFLLSADHGSALVGTHIFTPDLIQTATRRFSHSHEFFFTGTLARWGLPSPGWYPWDPLVYEHPPSDPSPVFSNLENLRAPYRGFLLVNLVLKPTNSNRSPKPNPTSFPTTCTLTRCRRILPVLPYSKPPSFRAFVHPPFCCASVCTGRWLNNLLTSPPA